jgi:hypothetical protein
MRLYTLWQGLMRTGEVTADDLSTEGFGPLCWVLWNLDVEWRGNARLGLFRHVQVKRSVPTAADGSTGGFGSLCCSLWRVDGVRQYSEWHGRHRRGNVGSICARQGLQTAVRRVRPPYCSLGNRFGLARSGNTRFGWAWCGQARRGREPQVWVTPSLRHYTMNT